MTECTVVGSLIIDLTAYMTRFPKPGETYEGKEFKQGFGGKGANQAVMANKLGCQVELVGKVGEDSFGREYLNHLRTIGINSTYVSTEPDSTTGVAQILITEDGSNSIIVIPAANMKLTVEDVDSADQVIRNSKVVICQLEVPMNVVRRTLIIAKEGGAKTILNPAPIPKDFDPRDNIFDLADIVCPNENEAAILFSDRASTTMEDFKSLLEEMHKRGCRFPIITLGDRGVLVRTEDGNIDHIPAPAVKAIDTSGAGDSFVGSLAYFLCHYPHLSLKEQVKRAVHIASLSVQRKGTQTSFPLREELPNELFA